MGIIIRLILRPLFRSRTGMLIVGALLVIIGLILGASSHQVSYQNQQAGTLYNVIPSTLGNLYVHADGSPDWFILQKDDISQPIIDVSTLPNGFTLDFTARTDTIDVNANLGKYGTATAAHVIEHLAFHDASGKALADYSTAEYQANPNGVNVNQWPAGGICIGLGVLIAILGFVIYRKKPQVAPAAPMGSFQQPMYPQENPYPGQAPVGQPQANPYAQPYPGQAPVGQPQANPYAQPYPGQPPVGQPQANPYQYPPQQ